MRSLLTCTSADTRWLLYKHDEGMDPIVVASAFSLVPATLNAKLQTLDVFSIPSFQTGNQQEQPKLYALRGPVWGLGFSFQGLG